MTRLPSLFVSHGAPTWALDPGAAGRALRALGERLPRPAAVAVVSPHWQTRGVSVSTVARPGTIHDFGGFDPALYRIDYPAPGHPGLAARAVEALLAAGFDARADARRGLDHGAWVPLLHLYPRADVPVFQVSMPHDLDGAGALRLGRALAPLAAEGVLVVGSGSLTHNLGEVFGRPPQGEPPYVRAFVDWAREAALAGDVLRLADAIRLAPQARHAHPSDEHWLPLPIAAAAAAPGAPVALIDGGISYRVLSMDAFVFGALPGAVVPASHAATAA